jgi:hypothetical protein
MKLIVRWSVTLGLLGSTLLGTLFGVNFAALALTPEQIKEKLDTVPVYLVTNDKGLPLSRAIDDKDGHKKGSVTGVYMSRKEAEDAVNLFKANPDPKVQSLVKNLQVSAVPLGVIYQQLKEAKNSQLIFAFKPVDKETQAALDLLHQSGQKIDKFDRVPIFAVRFAPNKGYVPILGGSDKQQFIPLFLSKQDADGLLTQVKPKFPNADIQVIDVDGVINTLQAAKNDDKNNDWLKQVVLIPSQESRDYIKTLPNKGASIGNVPSVTSK